MELIIGGRAQGKLDYALKATGYGHHQVDWGTLGTAPILCHLEELVKKGEEIPLKSLLEKEVILCDEIGCGVVPMNWEERDWREKTGRLCCALAKKATRVTRICCGLPMVLKGGRGGMRVELIRHSLTQGNVERRYLGATDQGLCPQGEALAQKMRRKDGGGVVYASPMLRCVQTAQLLFPEGEIIAVPGLEETRFGAFEYRTHQELEGREDYQRWIESGGVTGIPGGESREEFAARCSKAFITLVDGLATAGADQLRLVTHGGVIMALCAAHGLPQKDFYDYQLPCCQGWTATLDPEEWRKVRKFRLSQFGGG